MNKTTTFILDGDDKMMRIFETFEENGYKKPIMAAFRKAAAPVRSAMAANIPSNMSATRKVLKTKAGKGVSLSVGFYGNQGVYVNRRGEGWSPWMLLYWQNYGTYANRYPGHTFQNARRERTARRRGGIKPGLFVERAWEQSKGTAQRNFEAEWLKQYEKFLQEA